MLCLEERPIHLIFQLPIANGKNANIGSVSLNAVVNSIYPSDENADTMKNILNMLGDMYKENPNEPELSQLFELKKALLHKYVSI